MSTEEFEEKKLVMSFEPNTIKHLGVQMYSTIPPALAEMVANSYDACAKEVYIKLYDGNEKKIIVSDTGTGMTFNEVNDYFLRIGRNRRQEAQESSCERIPTGKKGLGKLALFGIGDTINIQTVKQGEKVEFTMDWNDILHWSGSNYQPTFETSNVEGEPNGTIITLNNLKRKSNFSALEYAVSLSKFFNFLGDDFKVFISLNDGEPIIVDNKLKYENITPEFSWTANQILELNPIEYVEKENIKGEVITTEKPLKPGLRGITLFANGRMVNFPEFFGQSESSHFYSYATGWLDIDFVDNWEEDVISTNRQSIDWENEKTLLLREFLASCLSVLEKAWREKRKQNKIEAVRAKTNIDVSAWYGTMSQDIQEKVESIVNLLDSSPELSSESQQTAILKIHELIPEYPFLHWRHLHPVIQQASGQDYKNKDYYRAFDEAMKRYINSARVKSGSANQTDSGMMGEVFGRAKALSVTRKYKKPNGSEFTDSTLENIESGQKFLSMGILAGGRNPVAHEEISDLRDSGLFSEKDCLDALSLLSHLARRLDDA